MKIFQPKMNRKGALELSINAVVVLILAITMLGLGLGFIRGMFGSTIEQFQALSGQLEEEDRNTLAQSPDEITFLTSKIPMVGRSKTLYFALRNNQAENLEFQIKDSFVCYDAISGEAAANAGEWITFDTYDKRTIAGTASSVMPLTITIAPAAIPTIYSCKMEVPYPSGAEASEITDVYSRYEFEIEYSK